MKQIALVGMPNCGKSSLFNLLTGQHAHVGNRPGVTVGAQTAEKRLTRNGEPVRVVDLPGIRSPRPSSEDERVTVDALTSAPPDVILFVCDATNFRDQFTLLQGIRELAPKIPVTVAFNFCDELQHFPDSAALSGALGIPSAAVSARTGRGIDELSDLLSRAITGDADCKNCPNCPGCAGAAVLSAVLRLLGDANLRPERISAGLDRLFLHPVFGWLASAAVLLGILWITFDLPGNLLTEKFTSGLLLPLSAWLSRAALPAWLASLLQTGILGGVGAVLEFLPRLWLLFLLQSIAEQTGFLSRVARIADRPMRRFGLRGDAVAPMLLGFGCSVPAILCTRTMKDEQARSRCIRHLPAVACSARIPLCVVLVEAFFPFPAWLVCAVVWLFSGLIFLLFCGLSAKLGKQKDLDCHTDPLPRWRLPSAAETVAAASENLAHFLTRAGGVILLSSVLIWLLSVISPLFGYLGDGRIEESLLALLGRWIAPLFAPLGFGNWKIAAALLAGIGAKESALSVLGVLTARNPGESLAGRLAAASLLTPAGALSLCVFYCLYFPCTATVATMYGEKKRNLPALVLHLAAAYLAAWAVFLVAGRWM